MNRSADRRKLQHFERTCAGLVLILCFSVFVSAQADAENNEPSRGPGRTENQARGVKEFIAKQRAEKAKKDHEELLRRGDELIRLTGQLENAFEQNKTLTDADQTKLEAVEKLVTRIRKGLGGDNDDREFAAAGVVSEENRPGTTQEAFESLKDMSVKLVDELKKTSRFTVSVLAIQSSNSVLKIVRFLRLRK